MITRTLVAVAGCICLGSAGLVAAQIPTGDIEIRLDLVADGLTAPVTATSAGDGSGRLFVVDQPGQIRIIKDGQLLATPFLDVSDKIPALNGFFDERGLLGLAFHPNYASNGRFFVRYSAPREGDPDEPCNDPDGFIVGCHSEVLAEYAVSGDPDIADPDSEILLFSVEEPQFNHDSGQVAFGPDGFLYFSIGDGGGAHDGLADDPPSHGPIGNGQNIFTALGSILRLDVDSPPQDPLAYAIPPDNPFVGVPGVDEIYAYGMRNPYRFSFDDGPGGDGRLFLGEVGQNLFEEIDIVVKGGNYGWVIREGFHCFDPLNPLDPPAVCSDTGPLGEPLLDPVAEYDHGDGIAVIGGFVYRGSLFPELVGKYVFGDFSVDFGPTGRIFWLDADGELSEIFEFQLGAANDPLGLAVFGLGEDEQGEIYLLASENIGPAGTGGKVFHIVGELSAGLDVKPGSCPNPVNRGSHGVLPVALVGSERFDVTQVDVSTVRLLRADGVGGEVAPNEGPPGPHSVFANVATPLEGPECDCHHLTGDGIVDLSMKFRTDQVVASLELDDLPSGASVALVVSFDLLDGTSFTSTGDCITLVPPGAPPGLLNVVSNAAGSFIDVTPLDGTLDGGGFADFQRSFPLGTFVTLTGPQAHGGRTFAGWSVGGEVDTPVQGGISVSLIMSDDEQAVVAVFAGPGDIDADGIVGATDLLALLAEWGQPSVIADLDMNGIVGVTDLLILLTNWG